MRLKEVSEEGASLRGRSQAELPCPMACLTSKHGSRLRPYRNRNTETEATQR